MTKEKQKAEVREWLAIRLYEISHIGKVVLTDWLKWSELPDINKEIWRNHADQILSHPKLAILDDDQELPDIFDKETTAQFPVRKDGHIIQRDMLKANFRRILPREVKE